MVDEIKFKKVKRIILQIDGLFFDEPNRWVEHVYIGLCGLMIVFSLPLWIIPYLFSKYIKSISRKRITDTLVYMCPNCENLIKKIGTLFEIECNVCGWSGYLDHISKKTEISDKGRGN